MDLELLTKKAMKNDYSAQFLLGKYYLENPSLSDALLHAEKWFKKAASKNYPEAIYQLALLKINQNDFALAKTLLLRATKRKYYQAYYLLGCIYRGDYDQHLEDNSLALKMFYRYYKYDKINGLDPLLSVYSFEAFKPKEALQFLKEAADYGLIKAKYHLAMIHLENAKTSDSARIELEDYYHASGDVNAAKTLYYIYAPAEKKYAYPHKNQALAKKYLKACIEGHGTLEGSEYLESLDVYIEQTPINIQMILEDNLKRMKTSLAINEDFVKTISIDDFSLKLRIEHDILFDYDATLTYLTRHIVKEPYEKEIMKKQTVRKGFKKTGTVKVPKTIQKTKKTKTYHEAIENLKHHVIAQKKSQLKKMTSLKNLADHLHAHDVVFHFTKTPSKSQLKDRVESLIKKAFKKPRHSKKHAKTYQFETLYLLKPILEVRYTYKKTHYQCELTLSEIDDLTIHYPLNKQATKKADRFNLKQSAMKRNHYFTSILLAITLSFSLFNLYNKILGGNPVFTFLYRFYMYQVLIVILSALVTYFIHKKLPITTLSLQEYLKHYDDSNLESLKQTQKKNLFIIILKTATIIVLLLVNIFLHFI